MKKKTLALLLSAALCVGMLAGCGTHDELMRSCEVYQEIYYSQFPEERPTAGKEA